MSEGRWESEAFVQTSLRQNIRGTVVTCMLEALIENETRLSIKHTFYRQLLEPRLDLSCIQEVLGDIPAETALKAVNNDYLLGLFSRLGSKEQLRSSKPYIAENDPSRSAHSTCGWKKV